MEEKTNEPEVNIYIMTSCRAPRQKEAWYISLIEYKTAKGPVTKQWIRKEEDVTRMKVLKILLPHDFRICIKTDHEYGEWMRRTLRDATSQKKGEDKHV